MIIVNVSASSGQNTAGIGHDAAIECGVGSRRLLKDIGQNNGCLVAENCGHVAGLTCFCACRCSGNSEPASPCQSVRQLIVNTL